MWFNADIKQFFDKHIMSHDQFKPMGTCSSETIWSRDVTSGCVYTVIVLTWNLFVPLFN